MNTALLAGSGLSLRVYDQVKNVLQATVPWTDCGVIAAEARIISPMLLQELETRLAAEGKNMVVVASYDADEGILTVLLPGQSLAFTHFAALCAKTFLQEAGLLSGGMAVASFPESGPATEDNMADFMASLAGKEQATIAVYNGKAQAPATPKVVMIDPNAALLDFLGVRLGKQGYDVRPAHDGMEGLRLVETVKPDIVITELALPALDGYQLIHRISRGRSAKIVVLTDLTVEQDICKCFELGVCRRDPEALLPHGARSAP
ncbi:response regulator [Paenibacillus sp. P26]|nr:response regulator [Paenibacillus sp. P26]